MSESTSTSVDGEDPASPVRRRWLWIAGELSEELTTGLLVYSAKLARAVAGAGNEVTMIGLGDPDRGGQSAPCVESLGAGSICTLPICGSMRSAASSITSRLPNLTNATASGEIRRALRELLLQRWDVVVIDHLQAAWALSAVVSTVAASDVPPTLVFVTHNHEASMRADAARRAPGGHLKRALLAVDARKAGRLERATVDAADIVTAITAADAERFAADRAGLECLVLPPGWEGIDAVPSPTTPIAERPRRVGILGSFEWHVKQENLRRFVAVADPAFAAAGIELVVGGAVADELRAELEPQLRATRLVGWVDDLDAFFDDIRIGVVSEPLGGGFKLKTLDYVFRKVPLAALSSSRSGIPVEAGTSVLEADDERGVVDLVVTTIDDADRLTSLADAALAACSAAFSWADRGVALDAAVRSTAQIAR
jgi:hypothetical protein